MATYVASKSSGMKFAAKLDQAKEKDVVALGEVLFVGTLRLRLCDLSRRRRPAHKAARTAASVQPGRGAQGGRRVAGLSGLDHPRHDELQHRLYDCYGSGCMPELELGADVSVALIS